MAARRRGRRRDPDDADALRRGLAGRARLGHRPGRRAAGGARLDRPAGIARCCSTAPSGSPAATRAPGCSTAWPTPTPCSCLTTASTSSTRARTWRTRCSPTARGCGSWRPAGSRSASPASRCCRRAAEPARPAWPRSRVPGRPAVRRPGGRGQPRLRGRRRDGGPRHRHRPPPGRAAAGDRAGRRPAQDAAAGRDLPAADRPVPAAHRRQPHRPAAAPHAARRRRVELGPAHPGGAAAGRAVRGLPGRGDARRGGRGLRGRARGRRRLDPADIDDLLSSLVDKSLLQPVRAARRGRTRLRMLETVREYGTEQLAGRARSAELRRRHAAHYSALMAEAAPRLLTRDQVSLAAAAAGRPRQHPRRAALLVRRRRRRAGADPGGRAQRHGDAARQRLRHRGLGRPGPRGAGRRRTAGEDLRTIAEALHQVTGTCDTERRATERCDHDGLAERVDALDFGRHPLVGLLRQMYAFFSDDRERLGRYIDEAIASGDEWLVAVSWMMRATLAENDGEVRRAARRRRRGGAAAVPRARRAVGAVKHAAAHRRTSACWTATWTGPPPPIPRRWPR